MKRCVNPNCNSRYLFSDDKTVCPFCHSNLSNLNNNNGLGRHNIMSADSINITQNNNARETVSFINENLFGIECHGRITEIEHHELFNDSKHKLASSIFRGEPYQLAHQTVEYTIRVENISESISDRVTDFCLYGNYLGRIHVGDEVIVKAKCLIDRRIVKSLYNCTTGSAVNPGIQIPAWVIRSGLLLIVSAVLLLILSIVNFFKSDGLAQKIFLGSDGLMPLIIICIGFYILIKSFIPRRRR